MRKNSNSRMQQTLPIDIIVTNILPRLPPASLLFLKCLNKFFYRLISSKEFINDHLHQSLSSDTNHLLIFCTSHSIGVQDLYSLDLGTPNSSARYIPLPEPFNGYFDIVGSCNGLICLQTSSSFDKAISFIVLNPSTRTVKPISAWRRNSLSLSTGFGFGYDRISDDYKVVVVCYTRKDFHDEIFSSVSVCSIKTNSWKYAKGVPISRIMINDLWRWSATLNGVLTDNNLLHWVKCSSNGSTCVIGCFNLESEKWVDDVPFPDFGDIDGHTGTTICLKLGVLDGCLRMFTVRKDLSYTELWVMKEHGVKESWVKFVATPSREYNPLFANGKKELLLSRNWPHKPGVEPCVWYNFKDQTTRTWEFSGVSSDFKFLTLSLRTLVAIHGSRQIKKRKATKP